jgi:RNA polymerase sigma factor (sigma-70 family)
MGRAVAVVAGFLGRVSPERRPCSVVRVMSDAADGSSFDHEFPGLFLTAYRVTYRLLGDVAQAEDAAAEALTRALVAWQRVGDLDHRAAWVARVAGNVALDELRRRGRRRWSPWPVGAAMSSSPPVDMTEEATLRLALGAALSALSPRQREVIALRYLADLDEAEVSRVLGISVNSVKKHAVRGRAALRERLGPNREMTLALD